MSKRLIAIEDAIEELAQAFNSLSNANVLDEYAERLWGIRGDMQEEAAGLREKLRAHGARQVANILDDYLERGCFEVSTFAHEYSIVESGTWVPVRIFVSTPEDEG